jgi:hypothetical protein
VIAKIWQQRRIEYAKQANQSKGAMQMSKILLSARTQNGRRAIEFVGEDTQEMLRDYRPRKGRFEPLGYVDGVNAFKLVEDNGDNYAIALEDAEPVVSAVKVAQLFLQGGKYCTLLHAREGSVWREYGYKQRSSDLYTLLNGQRRELPSSIALALGLIEPSEPAEIVELAPALEPAFSDAMQTAFSQYEK